uniref:Uncharacterized protein n=1 Tax=Acrobeloides nanus TaxID=290746 RepID=A0A914C0S3_9BILA
MMLEPVVPEQYYRHRSNSCSGCTATPILSSHRPPALGGRSPQSSFESNGDVGQISLNWMRFNGTIAPFKTLLKSSDSNTPPPTKPSHAIANDSICRVSSYNRIIGLNSSQPLVVTEIYKDRESSDRDCSEERHTSNIRITYDG